MTVVKLSVSFDAELDEAIRAAARKAGQPVSTWVAEAAASKLRREALRVLIDEWQAEEGSFTPDQIAAVRAELAAARVEAGLPPGVL
ncbi:MAG: hypothetical protein ACT4PP_17015 [Sporichthyaceae bacterium]